MNPEGVGGNEASVEGLLLVFGVDGGAGAGAALVQRLLITGMAITLGRCGIPTRPAAFQRHKHSRTR